MKFALITCRDRLVCRCANVCIQSLAIGFCRPSLFSLCDPHAEKKKMNGTIWSVVCGCNVTIVNRTINRRIGVRYIPPNIFNSNDGKMDNGLVFAIGF